MPDARPCVRLKTQVVLFIFIPKLSRAAPMRRAREARARPE